MIKPERKTFLDVSLLLAFILVSTSIVGLGSASTSLTQSEALPKSPTQPMIQNKRIDLNSYTHMSITKLQTFPLETTIPPNTIPSSKGTALKDIAVTTPPSTTAKPQQRPATNITTATSFPAPTPVPGPIMSKPMIKNEPIPNSLATTRGCRGINFDILHDVASLRLRQLTSVPGWVTVLDKNPITGKAPPPLMSVEGVVVKSKVAVTDSPVLHDSHDWTFVIKVDPQYMGLISTGNYDFKKGQRLIEGEWEIGTKYDGRDDRFPKKFWPAVGDRAWVMGHWVFDCGHEYRTEIHPAVAVAFTRKEPTTFPAQTAPSHGIKTFIYIHGKGGYTDANVGGTNYAFDIPADELLRMPHSQNAKLRTQVLELPFGGPAPKITLIPSPENPTKIHIEYPLASIPPSPNHKFGAVIAAAWQEPVATRDYGVFKVTFDSIRVNNDHEDDLPGSSLPGLGRIAERCGEYKLWAHVNGHWISLLGTGPSEPISSSVCSGDTKKIGKSITVLHPKDGNMNIQTTGWESDDVDDIFGCAGGVGSNYVTNLLKCMLRYDALDPSGLTGAAYVAKQWADPNEGLGTVTRTLPWNLLLSSLSRPISDPSQQPNDFILNYHIEQIRHPPGEGLGGLSGGADRIPPGGVRP